MPIRKVPTFTPEELEEIRRADAEIDREGRKKFHHLSQDDVNCILSDARNGENAVQIAKKYGVDPGTIRYHLKKAGIATGDGRARVPEQVIKKMLKLHAEGVNYREIAKRTKCTKDQVLWYCYKKRPRIKTARQTKNT